jgi:hypothetical protein
MIDRSLKNKVAEILYWKPYTRNSDIYLWVEVVNKWYWSEFLVLADMVQTHDSQDVQMKALKNFMMEAPNQDNIKRIRAYFNQKKKFLPTDPKVAKARKLNEKEWRIYLEREGLKPGDHFELDWQNKHVRLIRREAEQGRLLPRKIGG